MKSRAIIKEVAAAHNLQPHDLTGPDRFGHFCAARREAAGRLREMGFSYYQIGAFLNRDHTSIIFYVNPEFRARKKKYAREYNRRKAELSQ